MLMGGLAMSWPSRRLAWPCAAEQLDRGAAPAGAGPGRAGGVTDQWSERG